MENITCTCPVCGNCLNSKSRQIPYPRIEMESKDGMLFSSIMFCQNCGLGIALPEIPEDILRKFYESGKFLKLLNRQISLKVFPVPFALAKSRWKDIESLIALSEDNRDMKILDIGAGQGCIGLVANQSKHACLSLYTCVEPDSLFRENLENCWSQLGNIQKLEIKQSIDNISGQYHVVVLSHVLEHLSAPVPMLESAISLLAPGGILLIDAPNMDYLFKKDVFPHALFFSVSSVKYMLNKENSIEIVSIEGRGPNMFHSPLSKKMPTKVKLAGKFIELFYNLLPGKVLVLLFTRHFEMNHVNPNGIWIRALCRKKK